MTRFIRLRKFETLSLHYVLQGFKVKQCGWLLDPRLRSVGNSSCDNSFSSSGISGNLSNLDNSFSSANHSFSGANNSFSSANDSFSSVGFDSSFSSVNNSFSSTSSSGNHVSHIPPSAANKQYEILCEFVYWLFDSFLTSLIQ
ncbi:hypothetical protein BGW38_010878, partial [Lunasporangiospora selenospora]